VCTNGVFGPSTPAPHWRTPEPDGADVARLRRHYVVTLSVVSPLQYWSMEYFWVHMIQHVTVMLAAPALYVAGAPAIPLTFALPWRRVDDSCDGVPSAGAPITTKDRRGGVFTAFAIVFFNAVMVVWMIPRVFNPAMGNPNLHVGLMLTSFFVSGLLFWMQFIPSRHGDRRSRPSHGWAPCSSRTS